MTNLLQMFWSLLELDFSTHRKTFFGSVKPGKVGTKALFQKGRECIINQWEVNGDLNTVDDELIARLQFKQNPYVQKPIHLWVQKVGGKRFVVFLFQKYNQPKNFFGFQTHNILNADKLYTAEYKMPQIFEIDGVKYEYVDSRWIKLSS